MRAYLFAVAGTVVISAILYAIAPEGKLSSTIKTAAKLVCLIVIAQPIAAYFVSVKNGESNEYFEKSVLSADEEFINYCCKIKVDSAERAVESEILNTYSLKANAEIDWVLLSETSDIKILEIRLIFSKETEAKEREKIKTIQSELEEKHGVSVSVTFADEALKS